MLQVPPLTWNLAKISKDPKKYTDAFSTSTYNFGDD